MIGPTGFTDPESCSWFPTIYNFTCNSQCAWTTRCSNSARAVFLDSRMLFSKYQWLNEFTEQGVAIDTGIGLGFFYFKFLWLRLFNSIKDGCYTFFILVYTRTKINFPGIVIAVISPDQSKNGIIWQYFKWFEHTYSILRSRCSGRTQKRQ